MYIYIKRIKVKGGLSFGGKKDMFGIRNHVLTYVYIP